MPLLFPGWMMRATVRLLGPRRYTDVAFWLAKHMRSEDWFGRDEAVRDEAVRDEAVRDYVRETMARGQYADLLIG